ncbi:MAG TPA: tRNA preQ1(34) S-adenosylmethionine ribosyltransferase-isomerase QueA [bacterium]|nr:tRNA preQ1(34) S-adenosylmethionine ribosyltransferase-isomerase QueA [bacterium]
MNLNDFDYQLPTELIAQAPVEPRDEARLMVVNRSKHTWQNNVFKDLPKFLKPDDILLVNNSKVLPARLFGTKAMSGGKIEILLEHQIIEDEKQEQWRCLIGGTRPKIGTIIELSGKLKAEIIEEIGNGIFIVAFNLTRQAFWQEIYQLGQMPLPPYIKPDQAGLEKAVDDYQTVYADADRVGSVAAPTAGLHFTNELLEKIRNNGIEIIEATLHVGLGTFAPIRQEQLASGKLHEEIVEISADKINRLVAAKRNGQRIIAVGTTSVRILEGVVARFIDEPATDDWRAPINLFIYPGFEFKLLGGLVTNFHLPKSSLMMLVSAWGGTELMREAYQAAITERYRFFSYGDAMLII